MGSLTTFGRNTFINHTFNTAYTPEATIYLVLCTADPTISATGPNCNEIPNTNGYSRAAITFGAASARRITQSAQVNFPTASGPWGTVTHWCLATSSAYGTGDILAFGAFSSPFSPVSGNTVRVATGQVYIDISSPADTFTTSHVNSMLGLMFANTPYATKAGSTYLALLNVNSSAAATTMAGQTEVSGTDYGRVQVNATGGGSPSWTNSTTGAIENNGAITWPTVGTGGWSQIVGVAIVDSISGTAANVIAFDNTNVVDQTPGAGDTVQFPTGDFDISIT